MNHLNEISGGEIVVPTRGNDWDDNGEWRAMWQHTWRPNLGPLNDAWSDIFNGIGKVNFTFSVVNSLPEQPVNIDNINAELKVLRAYYYYLAMDMFGNPPLVTDYNTDPNTVTNSSRKDVFDYIEKELQDNIALLTENKDASTYGRFAKWAGFMLLAKLYLNAEVYTGKERFADCISVCDSVINSGKYSLGNYFDNFAIDNEGSSEN
nr:RagB/SusD family nutrient uptake outer membrane protein [Chitinophagaceae bacterium]